MANKKDPRENPGTTSKSHEAMSPRWAMMETLLGGTESMRAAREEYTPKHEEETPNQYETRLSTTVLLNMTEQTLDTLCGKPFKEGVKLKDDVPEEIATKVLENVDLQGNSLSVFCRQWFREGFAKAFAHCLIDFPRKPPEQEGRKRTLDDDRRENLRPYWVFIKPENLIFAHAEIENGVEVLKHVRILECTTEMDGFAEKEKYRIRVLEPGFTSIYKPVEQNGKIKEDEWELEDSWTTGLDYIPLVTFYSDRKGFMYGKPPLMDLAYLNVGHWQSSSDQRHILTVSRFPMLACSGSEGEDGDKVIVGPNQILYNPDPKGKFYYVEHTGAAIGAGRHDLQDLETNMSKYGAEFLKEKPGSQTATARALDSAEATSDLASMTINFEDAVAQALDITADWMALKKAGGHIELVKAYDLEEADDVGVEALKEARRQRDISRKSYLNCLGMRGILPDNFDAEEDMKQLLIEAAELSKVMFDLDPAQKDDDKGGEDDDEEGKKGQKEKQVAGDDE